MQIQVRLSDSTMQGSSVDGIAPYCTVVTLRSTLWACPIALSDLDDSAFSERPKGQILQCTTERTHPSLPNGRGRRLAPRASVFWVGWGVIQ